MRNKLPFQIYKKIIIPDTSRIFFFGDVHGKKNEVDSLIKKVNGNNQDHFFFIGDLIDRGKHNSAMLFDLICKENYHMVLGNHESFMINSCDDEDVFEIWTFVDEEHNNGGLDTYHEIKHIGMEFFSEEIIKKASIILEVEHRGVNFGMIHAEIPFFKTGNSIISNWQDIINTAKESSEYCHNMLWGRSVIQHISETLMSNQQNLVPYVDGIDYVMHGHTGIKKPFIEKNIIWFDTAYESGKISMLEYNYEQKGFIVHQLGDEPLAISRSNDLIY